MNGAPGAGVRRSLLCGPAMALAVAIAVALLSGCAGSAPTRQGDVCAIYDQKPRWHKHTRRAAEKWRVDEVVLLAIMKQESAFDANAKPRRKRFLGFIPLGRPSSAFGYPQALDQTWDYYREHSGNTIARRDRFRDAVDFIAWYVAESRSRLSISPRDAYRNYLAYHEGWGGYKRATYRQKGWLTSVARRVADQAKRYRTQISSCR